MSFIYSKQNLVFLALGALLLSAVSCKTEQIDSINIDDPTTQAPSPDIPGNQELRLPPILHGWDWGYGSNIDITYRMVLHAPYLRGARGISNISDGETLANVFDGLENAKGIDPPNLSLSTIEDHTPLADQGLLEFTPGGDVRLLNASALVDRVRGLPARKRVIFFPLYLREDPDPNEADENAPPRYTFIYVYLNLEEVSADSDAHFGWKPDHVHNAPRNSFGRVRALKPAGSSLRYELMGEHSPFIIHPVTGRLGVRGVHAEYLLPASQRRAAWKARFIPTYSLEKRRLQVAITDENGQRVEKDVDILPALPSEGCAALPAFANDEDGSFRDWVCKNVQPTVLKDYDGNLISFDTSPAYTNSLPDSLTYSKERYKLIFADEFSTPQANTDYPAVKTLNGHLWEVNGPCPEGAYLRNGNLYLTTAGPCKRRGVGIASDGKFDYRYGYIEIRLSRVMDSILDWYYEEALDRRYQSIYRSLNIATGGRFHREGLTDDTIRTYTPYYLDYKPYFCPEGAATPEALYKRRILETSGVEHSIFEYRTTTDGGFGWHVLFYRGGGLCHTHRIRSWIATPSLNNGNFIPDSTGVDDKNRAFTMGVEWTPKGYRYFMNGEIYTNSATFRGEFSDGYYAQSIDHTPHPIKIFAHVNVTSDEDLDPTPSYTLIDYVRVYQPQDPDQPEALPYADIPKLYQ